jgi:hypothetical protein
MNQALAEDGEWLEVARRLLYAHYGHKPLRLYNDNGLPMSEVVAVLDPLAQRDAEQRAHTRRLLDLLVDHEATIEAQAAEIERLRGIVAGLEVRIVVENETDTIDPEYHGRALASFTKGLVDLEQELAVMLDRLDALEKAHYEHIHHVVRHDHTGLPVARVDGVHVPPAEVTNE